METNTVSSENYTVASTIRNNLAEKDRSKNMRVMASPNTLGRKQFLFQRRNLHAPLNKREKFSMSFHCQLFISTERSKPSCRKKIFIERNFFKNKKKDLPFLLVKKVLKQIPKTGPSTS
jgi:hypothetical protein